MEEIVKKSILCDLYSGLLSKKEQNVYELHIVDDLSFTEIGEELGVSRQAAYDLYKNADKKLKDIDEKLMLSTRFKEIENLANKIKKVAGNQSEIINLSNKIISKVT